VGPTPGQRPTRRPARSRTRAAAPHPLLVCDEVGYIPFAPEAAALFFALVSSRYERASLIVSSNKPFSAWAEIFGDAVAAMVDRLVHHAEIVALKGDSYRLKNRRKEVDATG
jgi:DNA replication protein DnaC